MKNYLTRLILIEELKMINIDNIIRAYEYEVVSWIIEHCKDLGFEKIIEKNDRKVPDLVMLRDGKKVRVEVEMYSSSFLKHKHNPDDADEVLCVVNDKEIPVKTIVIKQLRFWYDLSADELVDFFKEMPDTLMIHHKKGLTVYHFQDEWLNLTPDREKSIRESLREQHKPQNQ